MTEPRVRDRPVRHMFLRDGRVIDVSCMDADALAQFAHEIEKLTAQNVRLMNGIEFIVEGDTIPPRSVRADS